MVALFMLLIIIAVAASAVALALYLKKRAAREKAPLSFTLLTANIGNASPMRILTRFKLADEDTTVIRENLGIMSPDIVCLQELSDEDQIHLLLNAEKYHVHFRHGNCTAVLKDTFSSLQPAADIHDNDGYSEYSAEFADNRARLKIFNVHTEAPLHDASFSRRGAQIRTLLARAKAQAAGGKVIVAGDFNFDPGNFVSFRHRIMKTDSVTELDATKELWNETLGGSNGALRVVSPDTPTWSMLHVPFNIDHIISNVPHTHCEVLQDEDKRIDVDHTGVYFNANHDFMDHRAIIARFVL